ncbi:MAG: hypothetical protein JXB32_17655 [Deltaproteobacteria bacterium]|nr:hypothetical protein [Deltaproteobacteria bacterium]
MRTVRLPILLAALGLGALVATCDGGAPGACDGIACSGHGYCVAVADIPYCVCAAGYHPVGAACEPNAAANPCEGIDCDGYGICRVEAEAPACECAAGYESLGALHCVPASRPDAGTDDAGTDDAVPEDVAAEEETVPRCGDGIVQTGEECDDGNGADDDACLSTCRTARCGDGVVWSGVEECDTTEESPCTTVCGSTGWAVCADCTGWTCVPPAHEDCNGIDDDCDGETDEDSCGWAAYCLDGGCWALPSFEQGPPCADLGTAHPAPDYLQYYQVRGRPGARVDKWNRHVSCAYAPAVPASETEPPNDVRIDADGVARLEFPLDVGLADCEFDVLGEWESWVVVDGYESNHVHSTYYLSSCSNVQTCDLGALYCPP